MLQVFARNSFTRPPLSPEPSPQVLERALPEAPGADPKLRWKNSKEGVRLIHAICEEKSAFLFRDRRPADRAELESGSRKSAWLIIAEQFNNPQFNPTVRPDKARTLHPSQPSCSISSLHSLTSPGPLPPPSLFVCV